MKENKAVQYLIVLVLFLVFNLFFSFTQRRIILNDGKGLDGVEYYKMAEEFSQGQEIKAEAPLVYRLGTPFLASLIYKTAKCDLIQGFFYANLIGNFLAFVLLFLFLKIYIKNFYLIFILLIFYLLHPLCDTRFIYFCPVMTDSWGQVFLLSGLLLIEKYRLRKSVISIIIFSAICFTGILFREYIFILPFALFFAINPLGFNTLCYPAYPAYPDFKKIFSGAAIILLPLAASIAGIALTHLSVTNTNTEHSFLKTTFYFLYEKSLFQYVYAWFIAVGPVVAVLIFFRREIYKFLKVNRYLLFLILCSVVLSFIGGTDSRRIILWFAPVILLLLGLVISNHVLLFKKISLIIPLVLFQSISLKIFTQIPEPLRPDTETGVPIVPVLGDEYFLNLISPLNDLRFEFVSFLKYSLAIGFLLLLLRYLQIKISKEMLT